MVQNCLRREIKYYMLITKGEVMLRNYSREINEREIEMPHNYIRRESEILLNNKRKGKC